MTSSYVFPALVAGGMASLVPAAAAACAVCGLDWPGATPVGALLFLMAMPFVVAGSIGAWLFWTHRRARAGHRTAPATGPTWTPGLQLTLRPMLWGTLILIFVALPIAGTWLVLVRGPAARVGSSGAPPRLAVYYEVPGFSLLERSGHRISREDLLGKVWIANFIFTSCQATCPRQTATMAQLQRDLASEPDIRLVSITVDPEHDTREVLTRYAERFHADPLRRLFLTAEEKAIYALAEKGFRLSATRVEATVESPIERAFASGRRGTPADPQGSVSPVVAGDDDTRDALVHDARFALVDRSARIRGFYSSLDPDAIARLRRDAKTLIGERG